MPALRGFVVDSLFLITTKTRRARRKNLWGHEVIDVARASRLPLILEIAIAGETPALQRSGSFAKPPPPPPPTPLGRVLPAKQGKGGKRTHNATITPTSFPPDRTILGTAQREKSRKRRLLCFSAGGLKPKFKSCAKGSAIRVWKRHMKCLPFSRAVLLVPCRGPLGI